jgi:membrane protein implicated in regulation of membrane protease activity
MTVVGKSLGSRNAVKSPSTWFGRMIVFVVVLLVLRFFFRWNISIVGSVLVTLLVYLVLAAFESRGHDEESG